MPFFHFEAHRFCTNIFFMIFAWILLKSHDIEKKIMNIYEIDNERKTHDLIN